jgi:hypothetical protein
VSSDEEFTRQVQRQARNLLVALTTTQTQAGDPDSALDVTVSMEALLSVTAAVLESAPAHAGRREMREATDAAADRLKLYVRQMRTHFQETGMHGLQMVAGIPAERAPATSGQPA